MIAVNALHDDEEGQMFTLVTKRLSDPYWGFNWGYTGVGNVFELSFIEEPAIRITLFGWCVIAGRVRDVITEEKEMKLGEATMVRV
jgi:hypothetical protein